MMDDVAWQVLSFYQHMGMALPEKPPLMMVESSALNEAEEREGRSGGGHQHGPVFHTRGLTLTVEYRAIRQVVTRDGRRSTQPVDLSARDRYEVRLAYIHQLLLTRLARAQKVEFFVMLPMSVTVFVHALCALLHKSSSVFSGK